MAFYQKYRSQKFSDLIGQDHVRDTLLFAIKSDKVSHAYLLTGPRGTGKTSTARLLAKAVNCLTTIEKTKRGETVSGEPCNTCVSCVEIAEGKSVDIVEIDAASHTGVDDVRDLIEKAQYAPVRAKNKIYIIDEVHMLSKSAFNALLKTLEEPPKHLVFILATTEAYKLPPTILSRVQRYDFKRVSKDDIAENLKKIAVAEKIEIGDDALELIALSAQGGHRDAIVSLEKISSLEKKITLADAENILGVADKKFVFLFLGAIFNARPEEGLKIAHRLYEDGIDMVQFNKDVLEGLRKILLFKESGKALFEDSAENIALIKDSSGKIDTEKLIKLIETFIKSGNLLKDIAYPVLPVEMAIVESCEQLSTQHRAFSMEQTAISPEEKKVKDQLKESSISSQDDNQKKNVISTVVEKSFDQLRTSSSDKGSLDSSSKDDIARDDKDEKSSDKNDDKISVKEMKPDMLNTDCRMPDAETQTISVFQMTDDIWDRVVAAAKKENNSLAALLRDAKPLEYSDTKLVLGVKFKFHKDQISQSKHLAILEKIFCDITGNKCVIACRLMDAKPIRQLAETEPVSGDELQKAAEEIFA